MSAPSPSPSTPSLGSFQIGVESALLKVLLVEKSVLCCVTWNAKKSEFLGSLGVALVVLEKVHFFFRSKSDGEFTFEKVCQKVHFNFAGQRNEVGPKK